LAVRIVLALLAVVFAPFAHAQESVCAEVKIEIKQTVTLERQAFDARLKIRNGLSLPVEAIDVSLRFTDAAGVAVPATTNPDDPGAAKFFFRTDGSTDITGDLNGTGVVAPQKTGEAHWLIVPTATAGGQTADGVAYRVGATITYRIGTETKTVEVTPDAITVKPQPKLRLDYFLTRDVYGDDPFTPAAEPQVPFTLGVRVWNYGYGRANAVAIESAQPQIRPGGNPTGLLVDFRILDGYVGDAPAQPSLALGFGAIDSGTAKMGRWNMTASLSGRFVKFESTLRHADEFGGALTALISPADIVEHDLLRDVLSDAPGRDGVRDFLALDGDVVRLYESDGGLVAGGAGALDVTEVSGVLSGGGNTRELSVAATPSGFVYARVSDPFNGQLDTITAQREDGKALPAANVWYSKERGANGQDWLYYINVFDWHGAGVGANVRYTLTTESAPVRGASLEGYVFEDVDGDGVRDDGEPAVYDAGVTLTHVWSPGEPWPPQNVTESVARTDALGRFVFTTLRGGQYALTSHAVPGYRTGVSTPGTAGGYAYTGPDAGTIGTITLNDDTVATGYLFAKVSDAAVPQSTDLAVTVVVHDSPPITTQSVASGIVVAWNYGLRATPARVQLALPTGAELDTARPERGTFDRGSGIWTLDSVPDNGIVRMPFTLRVPHAGRKTATASIEIADPGVTDTNPANNTASWSFDVIDGPVYNVAFFENTKQRVLMLAACPPAADGSEDAACLAARVQKLETLFESPHDIDHRIVTSEAAFLKEIRSRNWRTYWLDSGAARLLGDAAIAEIAQAQLRDEALVVDWPRGRGGDTAAAAKLEALLPVRRVDEEDRADVAVQFQGDIHGIDATLALTGGYDRYESLSSWAMRFGKFRTPAGPIGDANLAPLQVLNDRTIVFGFDLMAALDTNTPAYRRRFMGAIQATLAIPRAGNLAAGRRFDVMAYVTAYGAAPIATWVGMRLPADLAVLRKSPDTAAAIDGGIAWTRDFTSGELFMAGADLRTPVDGGTYTLTTEVRRSNANGTAGSEPKTLTLTTQGATEIAALVRTYLPDAGSAELTERLAIVDEAMRLRGIGEHAAAIGEVVKLSAAIATWRTGAAPELVRLATALGDLGEVLSREWYLALPPCAPPLDPNVCRTPEQ
jgi:hypothetical protein